MKLKGISEHLLSSEMINIGYARFTHVAKDANKIHEIVRMTIRILQGFNHLASYLFIYLVS